jgi:hypothetical protein
MSSASTKLAAPAPPARRSSPARTASAKNPSLKFCANQPGRLMVHSTPLARTAASLSTIPARTPPLSGA